jgi:formylmethanofuran dehydrogenase subunit D
MLFKTKTSEIEYLRERLRKAGSLFKINRIQVAKLNLKSGDTLVVKSEHRLVPDQVKEIRKAVECLVPEGVKIMIVTPPISLEVKTESGETIAV